MIIQDQNISAVFFDWDGTLINNFDFFEAAHDFTRKALNLPERRYGWYKDYFGKPRDKIFEKIYGQDKENAKLKFYEFIEKKHLDYVQPHEGAEDFLKKIKQKNIYCGVISNKKKQYLASEMKLLGWQNYFNVVIASGDTNRDKPHPDALNLAIEKTSANLEFLEFIYFGDTKNDKKFEKGAGVNFVKVIHGQTCGHRILSENRPFVITINKFDIFFDLCCNPLKKDY